LGEPQVHGRLLKNSTGEAPVPLALSETWGRGKNIFGIGFLQKGPFGLFELEDWKAPAWCQGSRKIKRWTKILGIGKNISLLFVIGNCVIRKTTRSVSRFYFDIFSFVSSLKKSYKGLMPFFQIKLGIMWFFHGLTPP
jgi:hypothetical protein